MTRTAARLTGFGLGYLFVVLLDRIVRRIELDEAAGPVAPVVPLRPACNCTVCQPGERRA